MTLKENGNNEKQERGNEKLEQYWKGKEKVKMREL